MLCVSWAWHERDYVALPKNYRIKLWKNFTENFISNFSRENPNVVWILLGNNAKYFSEFIQSEKIVLAAHPSPLAGGKFFGSRIFSRANGFLEEKDKIQW